MSEVNKKTVPCVKCEKPAKWDDGAKWYRCIECKHIFTKERANPIIIKLSKDDKKVLEPLVKDLKDSQHAFQMASQNSRLAHERMWEAIHALHPITKQKDFSLSKGPLELTQIGGWDD